MHYFSASVTGGSQDTRTRQPNRFCFDVGLVLALRALIGTGPVLVIHLEIGLRDSLNPIVLPFLTGLVSTSLSDPSELAGRASDSELSGSGEGAFFILTSFFRRDSVGHLLALCFLALCRLGNTCVLHLRKSVG